MNEFKQRILDYQKVPVIEKLQHVYEMNVFFDKLMTKEAKQVKEKLRQAGKFK